MKRIVIWMLSLAMLALWFSPAAVQADEEELTEAGKLIAELQNELSNLDDSLSAPDQATHQRAQQLAAQIFSDPDSYSRFIGQMTIDHAAYPVEKQISNWLWSGLGFYELQQIGGQVFTSHTSQFMQDPEMFYRAMILFPEELRQQAITALKSPGTIYERISIVKTAQEALPADSNASETMMEFSLFLADISVLTADDYHTFFIRAMSDSTDAVFDINDPIEQYGTMLFEMHPANFLSYLYAEDTATIQFFANKLAYNYYFRDGLLEYIRILDEVIYNSPNPEARDTALQLSCAALAKASYYYDEFYQNYSAFLAKQFYADPQFLLYLSDYDALAGGIGLALSHDTTANGCKRTLETIEELMAALPDTSPRYIFLENVCVAIEENMPSDYEWMFNAFRNNADAGICSEILRTLKQKQGHLLEALGLEDTDFIESVAKALPQYLNSDDSITVAEYLDILVNFTGDGLYPEHQKDAALILLTELIHQCTGTVRFNADYSQAVKNCFIYAPHLLFANLDEKGMQPIFDALLYDLSPDDIQQLQAYCLSLSQVVSYTGHYSARLLSYIDSLNVTGPTTPTETTPPTESTKPTQATEATEPTDPTDVPNTPVKIWVIVYEVVIVLAFIAVVTVIVVQDRKKFNAEEEPQEE